jgi:hypothetical protein
VSDAWCSGTRPAGSQGCSAYHGCYWYAGGFGGCSAACGPGTQYQTIECRNPAGAAVSSSWCSGSPPPSSQGCNVRPCVLYLANMGGSSCWTPYCGEGYGATPSCPGGYAQTNFGQACGNPNDCAGGCSDWTMQTFYNVHGWGCPGGYYLGATAVECTWQ